VIARAVFRAYGFISFLMAIPLVPVPSIAETDLAGHGGPVRGIAVAPDGKTAVTASFDYNLIRWDLDRQQPLARLVGHDAGVNAVALFARGNRAVSGSDDGTVAIWDLDQARLLSRWSGHSGKVASVAVAPDGTAIASGGWDHDVRLWNAGNGESRRLAGHEANVNAVAFSPDGAKLVSGDYDGKILIWRVADDDHLASIEGNGFAINALVFSPDGKLFSASADQTVRLWDLAYRRELMRYEGHDEPVVSLSVSVDGRLVAAGSAGGAIEIWRVESGVLYRTIHAARGPIWALAFTPDGKRLLSGGLDGVVRIWDVSAAGATEISPITSRSENNGDRGARLFRKCSACHDLATQASVKAGPTLSGLFGRRAGSVPGYPYSPALRNSAIVWTPETVNELFARGPDVVAPGSKMPLQKMPDAQDRAELIEFLERATRP